MIQTNFLYRIAVVIRGNDVLPLTMPLKSTHKPEVALVASKPEVAQVASNSANCFKNTKTTYNSPVSSISAQWFALHNHPKVIDDYKGLRIGDLRLHAALTWRDFRFIVISGFYPFLASIIGQRTLFAVYNN